MNEHSDSLRAAYDFDAPRRNTNVFDGWRVAVLDDFLGRMSPGSSVLELGAGAGQAAAYVRDRGYQVTAMDLSPSNVNLARSRGIDAWVGDFTDPDSDFGIFDGAFAMNSLLHVKKNLWRPTLRVIRNSLRPSGVALIVVWGGENHEGYLEDEWTDPPRFFAFYSDDDFASLPTPGFRRVELEFRHDDDEGGLHPQVLTLEAA